MKNSLHVGIDAANIRHGGGITHLSQLLRALPDNPEPSMNVSVWAPHGTLSRLPERPWLKKLGDALLEKGLLHRSWWQRMHLGPELQRAKCDVLFAPGGILPSRSSLPAVTISQNLLPFEPEEAAHFGTFSPMRLKYRILRSKQTEAFARSEGVIFLSNYAQNVVSRYVTLDSGRCALIPHGIEERFFQEPRPSRKLSDCTTNAPFRLLYVSILMPYKHQAQVAHAITRLRAQGMPLAIDFVGPPFHHNGKAFESLLRQLDPAGEFLRWRGELAFDALHLTYQEADGFVFASSCENLPNILIEAMASGLPVLCSNRGPMPEVLGDAGVLFDPLSIDSICEATKDFAENVEARSAMAGLAYSRARHYSWERCASDTFAFLKRAAYSSSCPTQN